MTTNEKTSVAYQFLCMDADGYARTGDICLKLEDAVKDVRARSAGLATVVGVLIEVPVMLLVVRVVNASKGWYEAGLR